MANSSPDSPLSSVATDAEDFPEFGTEAMVEEEERPPAKRLKVSGNGHGGGAGGSTASSAVAVVDPDVLDGMSDISEDTDGDVPSTPIHVRPEDDDYQEQVTICAWDGCDAGDLSNMDRLVEHIHSSHIEGRQKVYTCEWIGCVRKSMQHASGYALKAHMRSHTREKPFYCYLPGRLPFRHLAWICYLIVMSRM
jgi:hypothetical protein